MKALAAIEAVLMILLMTAGLIFLAFTFKDWRDRKGMGI